MFLDEANIEDARYPPDRLDAQAGSSPPTQLRSGCAAGRQPKYRRH